jgi:hypothetical protein
MLVCSVKEQVHDDDDTTTDSSYHRLSNRSAIRQLNGRFQHSDVTDANRLFPAKPKVHHRGDQPDIRRHPFYQHHPDYCTDRSSYDSEQQQLSTDAIGSQRFRRSRTNFSPFQLDALERAFHAGHYPDSAVSAALAMQLGLPESRIQVCQTITATMCRYY